MDADLALRRFERDMLLACAVITLVSWPLGGFRLSVPVGVIAGGLLVATSYRAIKGGVLALLGGASAHRSQARMMAGFIGRYALLAVLAYVMLVRLQLHPVGLMAGVSAPVFAAALQIPRLARSGRPDPRRD